MTSAAALLAAAVPSGASSRQVTIVQDDGVLLRGGAEVRAQSLDEVVALGVDVVKIRLDWRDVAPAAESEEAPEGFSGSDGSHYPLENWAKYDEAIADANARGLRVLLQIGTHAPDWASAGDEGADRPDVTEFGRFVRALGVRYGAGAARVRMFAIGNEPNLSSWLRPQWRNRKVPASPAVYRGLYLAGHAALSATGHSRDTILFGELAPFARGGEYPEKVRPLNFLRELVCVDKRYRPFRGRAARRRGCSRFKRLPGTGFAYHPYTRVGGPRDRYSHPDEAGIGELRDVVKALRLIEKRKRFARRGMPIWITEFAFQSSPPDPDFTPLARVPAYMGEAEWLAYREPRVASYAQYGLVDDAAPAELGERRYLGWQGGLRFEDGTPKPGVYRAFEAPLFVRLAGGGKVEVFGAVRGGRRGQTATIEAKSGSRFRAVSGGRVRLGTQGYFRRTLRLAGAARKQLRVRSGEVVTRTARAVKRR